MISTCNYDGWFEKMGLKLIQAKATKSDLKNKKTDDLLRGKPEQYIKEELDPPMNSSLPPFLRPDRNWAACRKTTRYSVVKRSILRMPSIKAG